MKLSVCASALNIGKAPAPFMDAVASHGFPGIEFWGWWNYDTNEIKDAATRNGQTVTAICTRFIPLTDPARREEYIAGLRETIPVARSLGCKTIISQLGNDTGDTRARQHQSIVDGLREAAPLLEDAGMTLVIEPLNWRDHPGYYLRSADEGFAIVREVASPAVRLLFDIYHQQITEGDILARILPNISLIGHFHAAGVPGRHELTTGELDYARIIEAIDGAGYNGWFGLEYFPTGDAVSSLDELRAYLTARGVRGE